MFCVLWTQPVPLSFTRLTELPPCFTVQIFIRVLSKSIWKRVGRNTGENRWKFDQMPSTFYGFKTAIYQDNISLRAKSFVQSTESLKGNIQEISSGWTKCQDDKLGKGQIVPRPQFSIPSLQVFHSLSILTFAIVVWGPTARPSFCHMQSRCPQPESCSVCLWVS